MELGLTAADALAHLFSLFRATPSGKRVVDGTLKLVALNSVAVAIRATADGDAKMKAALTSWTTDAKFEALATAEGDQTFIDAVDELRFIAGNVVGPVARETAEETVRLFCTEWKKAVLGEQNYAKEQLDAARDERRQQQDEGTLAVILDQFAGLRELIHGRSVIAEGAGSSSSGKVAERLAEAREIIDRDPKRAREICRDLRKYETLTADESFRVATNIGVASLRLGDFATAEAELGQALQLQPNNPKALYNAASVALRQDKVGDAVELARRAYEIEPKSGLAMLNYLDALRVAGDTNALLELLPGSDGWPADTPLAGVTMLYVALDKFEEAEAVARRAEQAEPDNPIALDLLAFIYLVPRRGLLNIDPQQHAREAERLLDRAIKIAETWETKAPLVSALFHRARARALQGKHSAALDDCAAAEMKGGERDEVNQLRGMIHLELRQFDAASDALGKVTNGRSRPEIAYPLAVTAMEQQKPARAIELLEPFLKEEEGSIAFRGAADILMAAYRADGRTEELNALLARLESIVSAVPVLAPIVAEEQQRRSLPDEAVATLETAAKAAGDPEERAFVNLQLANLLGQQKRFAEAAAKYDEVLAFAPDLEASRRRIIALLQGWSCRLRTSCRTRAAR
ncbi:MAG TPA: tetratricopeptide repeat protein [Thermoanaerobaculia bacterium]|nr:tetratricopeptide repeat protein [Thermoanaerobaculia bacterium]